MDTFPPFLTAAMDQAYEGTKREAADMVTLVRSQIAQGLDRDDILTAHVMYLMKMMRYDAAELATLIAVLTYEAAKDQA